MTHRIVKNAVALTIIQLVNYAVPLLVLLYLTNTLGVDLYGVLAFSQGIVALSGVLLDFGYGLAATDKVSRYRDRRIYVSKLIGAIFVVKAVLLTAVIVVLVVYAFTTTKYAAHKLIFVLSIIPIMGIGFTPTWFFQGIERMRFITLFTVLARVVFASLVILFVREPDDYFLVPAINGLSQISALFVALYFIWRLGFKIRLPSPRLISYAAKFTRHFFVSRIAVASYMGSATVILGLFGQPVQVAIYSMAEQLYRAMQGAVHPISMATYPYMSKEKDTRLMLRIASWTVCAVSICALIGYVVSPSLVSLVFSGDWLAAIPVLQVFLVAIIVNAAAVMMGYPLAAAVGRIRVANDSVVGGAVIYAVLLGSLLLLNILTPINIAIIMILSESYVLLHRILLLLPLAIKKKHVQKELSA